MKLLTEDFFKEDELRRAFKITVKTEKDEKQLSFMEGEPEDANIGRDFADIVDIDNLVKMAYEAGKNGESLEIDHKNYDSFDEF